MVKNGKSIERFAFPNSIEQVERQCRCCCCVYLWVYSTLYSTIDVNRGIPRKPTELGMSVSARKTILDIFFMWNGEKNWSKSKKCWERENASERSIEIIFVIILFANTQKSFVNRNEWMTLSHGRYLYLWKWHRSESRVRHMLKKKKEKGKKHETQEVEKEQRSNSNGSSSRTICKLLSHK